MQKESDMDQAERIAEKLIDLLLDLVKNEPNADAAAVNGASSLLTSVLGRIHKGNLRRVAFDLYRVAAALEDGNGRRRDEKGALIEASTEPPRTPQDCATGLLVRFLAVVHHYPFFPVYKGVSLRFEILISACVSLVCSLAEENGIPFEAVEKMFGETLENGRKIYTSAGVQS